MQSEPGNWNWIRLPQTLVLKCFELLHQPGSWHSLFTAQQTGFFFLVVNFFLPLVDLKSRVPNTVPQWSSCDLVQGVPTNSKQWDWLNLRGYARGETEYKKHAQFFFTLTLSLKGFFVIQIFGLAHLVHFFPPLQTHSATLSGECSRQFWCLTAFTKGWSRLCSSSKRVGCRF